nr:unnamed protein product [Digitaria exilis]
MPPHDGAEEPSARAPLLPPPAPRRAAARLHPLPLIVAAAFVASFRLLFLAPDPSYYQSLLLSLGSNDTAAAHLRALTLRPHIAGSEANALAAAYVLDALSSHSFPTHLTPYSVLLSYPERRSLSLSAPGRDTAHFALEQESYPGEPYAAEAVPTFLAYAASGSVAAEAVYANYGRAEDFAYLAARGVNVTGKVAVARYGKVYRGDIVRNARDAGAAAAVIYTDAKDYAAGKAFPDGPWMPPTGVQVGSTFKGVGDPTTPMWASSEGCQRLSIAEAMASEDMLGIPALPVSGMDGEAILQLIGGDVAPEDWQGGVSAPAYRLGPGPAVLNLTYVGNETMATIQNVISVIEGKEEPDRYIGSTEWVEENRAALTSRTVAYLNVDSAVAGPGFYASATPQLDELLKEARRCKIRITELRVSLTCGWLLTPLPCSNDMHVFKIGRLGGGGSDYSAFVQHIGISSVDMSFGPGYAVYHSLYDDFIWMEKFGDPLFQRHVAAASIWGLVALRLSDEEILPFNYGYYAAELENGAMSINARVLGMPVSLSPLDNSIKKFRRAVLKVDSELKIYGPSLHNDYGAEIYPGVDDAIQTAKKTNTSKSWQAVQNEIHRIARVINQAAIVLAGGLT